MSNFLKLLGLDVRQHLYKVDGCSYIPAWRALGMAGFPRHELVTFTNSAGLVAPCRKLFGGTAVALDMNVGVEGKKQRIYLPVLDMKGKPIKAGSETARDVSDTSARCLARAIAIVHGLGLHLYSKMPPAEQGIGAKYVEYLGLTPESTNLAQVKPLIDMKEIKDRQTQAIKRSTPYLGWHAAIAAARITDPEFVWEVMEFMTVDPATGEMCELPAMKLEGKGWMIGIRLTYKGVTHTHYLPIMGVEVVRTANGDKPMEHQPVDNPSVFQWHSAVMRCLAKAIATSTGYGISVYAKGDVDPLDLGEDEEEIGVVSEMQHQPEQQSHQQQRQSPPARQQAPARQQPAQKEGVAQQPSQPRQAEVLHQSESVSEDAQRRVLVQEVRSLLTNSGSEESVFFGWLGVKDLDTAPVEVLKRGQEALLGKQRNLNQVTRTDSTSVATRH